MNVFCFNPNSKSFAQKLFSTIIKNTLCKTIVFFRQINNRTYWHALERRRQKFCKVFFFLNKVKCVRATIRTFLGMPKKSEFDYGIEIRLYGNTSADVTGKKLRTLLVRGKGRESYRCWLETINHHC